MGSSGQDPDHEGKLRAEPTCVGGLLCKWESSKATSCTI